MHPSPLNLLCVLSIFSSFFAPSSSIAFSPAQNVSLFEDAFLRSNDSISLTQDKSCATPPSPRPPGSPSGVGRAFYSTPVRFLDHSSNATASFSCSFSFTITTTHSCPLGDGIAFLITSNTASFSLQDGYMGLPAETQDQDSFFAVEFDTSFDQNLDDINDNHVGIDADSVKSLASVDVVPHGKVSLRDGRELTSWIEYRHSDMMIRVWIGYSKQIKPKHPILVAKIDLSKRFKEFMSVGFTASNLRGSSAITVERWQFKTFLGQIPSTMAMDAVKTGDCFLCSPWDTSIEFGSFKPHRSRKDIMILLVVLSCFAAVLVLIGTAVVGCVCLIRRKGCRMARNRRQPYRFQGGRIVPTMLSLSEIRSATNGFNHDRVIGEGGSAVVYAGKIPQCGTVAIKRFNHENHHYSSSFSRAPFNTEFATMAGCMRHKNLVQLQGWCCERNELVLVYEYMAYGSLDKILHCRSNTFSRLLTWEKRLNIINGVASALVYLHEECESQIIHRDVKTCNILLDAELNAKLGDFGLAEVCRHSFRARNERSSCPAGTMGYLAPEYAYSGTPTMKTDVYSFGMVVLEVASGRRPVDHEGVLLSDYVWNMWERGAIVDAADPKLVGKFDRVEMERTLIVGLFCAHPNSETRPRMREAARMLAGEVALPVLPAKKPVVRIQSVQVHGGEEIRCSGDETPWSTPRTHFSRDHNQHEN